MCSLEDKRGGRRLFAFQHLSTLDTMVAIPRPSWNIVHVEIASSSPRSPEESLSVVQPHRLIEVVNVARRVQGFPEPKERLDCVERLAEAQERLHVVEALAKPNERLHVLF